MFINDTLFVTIGPSFPHALRVYDVRSTAPARVVYTQSGPGAGLAFSADGRWIAVGRQTSNGENRLIDVVSRESGSLKTLTVPFAFSPNFFGISRDGQAVIVISETVDHLTVNFHRVDVASGITTKLTTVKRLHAAAFHPSFSPDLRSLVYDAMQTPYFTFNEIDVTALLRGGSQLPNK